MTIPSIGQNVESRNSYALLVGVQISTTPGENNFVFSNEFNMCILNYLAIPFLSLGKWSICAHGHRRDE